MTKIANELELRHSIQQLARLYAIRERTVAEVFSQELREDLLDSDDAMICQIEGEVEEYFLARARAAEVVPEAAAKLHDEVARDEAAQQAA